MPLFAHLKRKRAIRQYARELPRRLNSDYGASAFFTPGQIATAARKLKLDPEFLVYGYTMFLPKESFEDLRKTIQNPLSYEEVRANFVRYNPAVTAENSNFYESVSGLYLFTPGDGGSGGTSS